MQHSPHSNHVVQLPKLVIFWSLGVRSSQIPLFVVSFQCFWLLKTYVNKSISWENISQEQTLPPAHLSWQLWIFKWKLKAAWLCFFLYHLRDGCTTPQHEELPRCIAPPALQTLGFGMGGLHTIHGMIMVYLLKSIMHGIRDLYGTQAPLTWDKGPLEWDNRRL